MSISKFEQPSDASLSTIPELVLVSSPDIDTRIPACNGLDPEVFYPEEDNADLVEIAKQICNVCPIRVACLEQAISQAEEFGIWGGLTKSERLTIIHKRKNSQFSRKNRSNIGTFAGL